MAKKFHQSMKDRVHEGVGEDLYLLADKRSDRARRAREMYKEGMIDEDHSAIANLPQGVKMQSYPVEPGAMRDSPDDTIVGVDRQMSEDAGKGRRYMKPHKY